MEIVSPMSGTLLNISEVPDQVFSQKMMGDGFAIDPTDGTVVAPIEGVVSMVFPSKHAIGLTNAAGEEILIHVGIDTVTLNGEGFEMKVSENQAVKLGQELLKVDLDAIRDRVPSLITSVVITNPSGKSVSLLKNGEVKMKEKDIVTVK